MTLNKEAKSLYENSYVINEKYYNLIINKISGFFINNININYFINPDIILNHETFFVVKDENKCESISGLLLKYKDVSLFMFNKKNKDYPLTLFSEDVKIEDIFITSNKEFTGLELQSFINGLYKNKSKSSLGQLDLNDTIYIVHYQLPEYDCLLDGYIYNDEVDYFISKIEAVKFLIDINSNNVGYVPLSDIIESDLEEVKLKDIFSDL